MNKEKLIDVIAGIFSIFFIAIVFYLYFIQFFHGAFYFNFLDNDKTIIYDQTERHSCHINIDKPTIVLRMDDVRAYSKLTKPLVDGILNRNISVTLGVIPRDLEKDKNIIRYLGQIKTNPYVEIAQHGTYHDESDVNITEESLLEGNAKIQKVLGVLPVTYIPPYNEVSLESRKIISNYFRIISGEQGIIKEGEKVAEIGYTVETYDYYNNLEIPVWEVIEKCKDSLAKTNLCVITIHPQDYSTNINNALYLSNEKFAEFKEMLDKLQQLNATSSTFKDVVYCEEEK